MDKSCGRSSVRPMITIAVAIRLIWGLSLQYTDALNASWLCPLLGIIFYLPIALAVNALSKQPAGCAFNSTLLTTRRFATAIISISAYLFLIIDAAATTHLLTNTADVMALGEAPVWLLSLPLVLLIFVCGIFGIEAEGRSARLWFKILLPLLVIVFFVQFRNYKPEWLTPIFGGGGKTIIRGALYCAGYMGLLSLPWLIAVEDTEHCGILPAAIWGATAASCILVLLAMLTPTLIRTTVSRSGRIELILSNGRVHLMLQLATVVLWFSSLLHLLNTETSAASTFLQKAMPGASMKLMAGITAFSVFACTISGVVTKEPFEKLYSGILYPVHCSLLLVLILLDLFSKKRLEYAKKA